MGPGPDQRAKEVVHGREVSHWARCFHSLVANHPVGAGLVSGPTVDRADDETGPAVLCLTPRFRPQTRGDAGGHARQAPGRGLRLQERHRGGERAGGGFAFRFEQAVGGGRRGWGSTTISDSTDARLGPLDGLLPAHSSRRRSLSSNGSGKPGPSSWTRS